MKYTVALVFGIIVFISALIVGLRIGNTIDNGSDEKQELIPYPDFETVLTQPYCKGMADVNLAEEWNKKCAKLLRERHCSLEPDIVDSLIAQSEKNIQMCER